MSRIGSAGRAACLRIPLPGCLIFYYPAFSAGGLDFPISVLRGDIANSILIAGDIAATGCLASMVQEAVSTLEDRPMGVAEHNASAVERAGRSRATFLGRERWANTEREIASGRLSHPVGLSPCVAGPINLAPRFAICAD